MRWETELVQKYQRTTGNSDISTSAVAHWAIMNGEYKPNPIDEAVRLATKLSNALRAEHFTDPQGRSVRLMHAVTNREAQTRMTFWYDMRNAPREIMKRAMQQRREQCSADNYQMKMDCDSYNENYNAGEPIQLVFDYTLDLEEIEAERNYRQPRLV